MSPDNKRMLVEGEVGQVFGRKGDRRKNILEIEDVTRGK